MNSTAETTPSPATRRVSMKTLWIVIAIAVLVGIGLYVGGLLQGRGELAAQKTGYEQQLASGRATLDQTNAQLSAAQNRGHLTQAQLALYRTATDLDRRNFGIANTHLQSAASGLEQVKAATGGIDTAKVAALRSEIAASDISVANDLQTQRDAILSFAERLEAIVPQGQ